MEIKEIKEIVDAGLKSVEENVAKKFEPQFEASKASLVAEIEAKGVIIFMFNSLIFTFSTKVYFLIFNLIIFHFLIFL